MKMNYELSRNDLLQTIDEQYKILRKMESYFYQEAKKIRSQTKFSLLQWKKRKTGNLFLEKSKFLFDVCYQIDEALDQLNYNKEKMLRCDIILIKDAYQRLSENYRASIMLLQTIWFCNLGLINSPSLQNMDADLFLKTKKQFLNFYLDFESISMDLGNFGYLGKVSDITPVDIYGIPTSLFEYKNLGEILESSVSKGYDYETYRTLADMFYTVHQETNRVNDMLRVQKAQEESALKQNAFSVIQANIQSDEILGLYEKEQLMTYRKYLLNTLLYREYRENGFEEDGNEIAQLQLIDKFLQK